MFRTLDIELVHSENIEYYGIAEEKGYAIFSDQWFAELQLLKLEGISKQGLWSCYSSFQDYLCDFYPNFEWRRDAMCRQIRLMLNDPRFPSIASKIQELFSFDLKVELEGNIKE
jgi:hypothetical protein